MQWLADGKYVYTTLDYRFTDEPALGFIVRSSPDSIHLEKLATKDTWYLFPNLLPDGNIGYIEAEPQHPKSDMWTGDIFEIRRGVIGQNNIETGCLKIRNAAWSPDGSSIALVVVKEAGMHENVIQMLSID